MNTNKILITFIAAFSLMSFVNVFAMKHEMENEEDELEDVNEQTVEEKEKALLENLSQLEKKEQEQLTAQQAIKEMPKSEQELQLEKERLAIQKKREKLQAEKKERLEREERRRKLEASKEREPQEQAQQEQEKIKRQEELSQLKQGREAQQEWVQNRARLQPEETTREAVGNFFVKHKYALLAGATPAAIYTIIAYLATKAAAKYTDKLLPQENSFDARLIALDTWLKKNKLKSLTGVAVCCVVAALLGDLAEEDSTSAVIRSRMRNL